MQRSLLLVLLALFVFVTEQQQCPIGELSLDQQKCYFSVSSPKTSFFNADIDCKQRAATVGIGSSRAFLASIPNAFENGQLLGQYMSHTSYLWC